MAHFYFVAQDIETTGVCAVYCGVHICCIFPAIFLKFSLWKKRITSLSLTNNFLFLVGQSQTIFNLLLVITLQEWLTCFWTGVVSSPTPNPRPERPGDVFPLVSTLKPAWLSWTWWGYDLYWYNLQTHGGGQASPSWQGNSRRGDMGIDATSPTE